MADIHLLRAINLGARNKVPMADLRALAADLGATGVRTLLNTGNLLTETAPPGFTDDLCARIASDLGVTTSCVSLTADDAAAALRSCPFPLEPAPGEPVPGEPVPEGRAFSVIYAAFLSEVPAPEAVEKLIAQDFGPDQAALLDVGSPTRPCPVVYLGYAGNVHSSKLSNARVEKLLGVTATSRNLSTVAKLAQA